MILSSSSVWAINFSTGVNLKQQGCSAGGFAALQEFGSAAALRCHMCYLPNTPDTSLFSFSQGFAIKDENHQAAPAISREEKKKSTENTLENFQRHFCLYMKGLEQNPSYLNNSFLGSKSVTVWISPCWKAVRKHPKLLWRMYQALRLSRSSSCFPMWSVWMRGIGHPWLMNSIWHLDKDWDDLMNKTKSTHTGEKKSTDSSSAYSFLSKSILFQ